MQQGSLCLYSSMSGWRLCHPGGEPVEKETPGAAASLALELLLPQASPADRAAALASALQQSDEEPDEEMHIPRAVLAPNAAGKVSAKKSKKRKPTTAGMTSAKSEGKVPVLIDGQMPLRRRKRKEQWLVNARNHRSCTCCSFYTCSTVNAANVCN